MYAIKRHKKKINILNDCVLEVTFILTVLPLSSLWYYFLNAFNNTKYRTKNGKKISHPTIRKCKENFLKISTNWNTSIVGKTIC